MINSKNKTQIRIFLFSSTSDAEMIANYRVQAELTAVESTPDGNALVLGTVDGCVSVLAIVDTQKVEMNEYLAQMPSRDENVSNRFQKFIHSNNHFNFRQRRRQVFRHSFIHYLHNSAGSFLLLNYQTKMYVPY